MSGFDLLAKNVAAVVAVCVFLGGWFTYNANSSWQLLGKYEDFQKYKFEESEKLSTRELKLKESELKLNAAMQVLADTKLEIENLKKETETLQEDIQQKERRLAALGSTLSDRAQQINDETDIKRLMSEVSALGVDLSSNPPCDNAELLSKYFRGQSLLHELSQRALAAHVYEKYRGFIHSNSSGLISRSSDDCTNKRELRLKTSSRE